MSRGKTIKRRNKMKKILFLIVLFYVQLFAETWKESNIFHGWKYNRVYFSDSIGQTLKEIYHDDFFEGISFYFQGYSSYYWDTTGQVNIEWMGNDVHDSIWISKYWEDDSLLNVPIEAEESLNLDEFRLLKIDSSQSFEISSIMDRRIKVPEDPTRLHFSKSLYFIYKRGASYYAYCSIGTGDPVGCDFFISCIFQNDGTLDFGGVPLIDDKIHALDGCPTSAVPPSRNLRTKEKYVLPSYNANGKLSNETSSGITLQKGISKLNLKK